jgi:fumarylacetoacetate
MAKLSKQGKYILEKFAPKYYEQVSLGLALTAYDRQQQLQATANPWELATSFDNSMVVGNFQPIEHLQQEDTAILSQDGQVLEELPLQPALQLLPLALRTVSEYMTLRTGDLVALPLTNTLYSIRADTTWQASVQTELLFSVTVK